MTSQTWFSTITHSRSHLIATTCVWGWFVSAIIGAALFPELAPWLDATAVTFMSVWYLVMMNSYCAARHLVNVTEQT